jgi:hypothetical protein
LRTPLWVAFFLQKEQKRYARFATWESRAGSIYTCKLPPWPHFKAWSTMLFQW